MGDGMGVSEAEAATDRANVECLQNAELRSGCPNSLQRSHPADMCE